MLCLFPLVNCPCISLLIWPSHEPSHPAAVHIASRRIRVLSLGLTVALGPDLISLFHQLISCKLESLVVHRSCSDLLKLELEVCTVWCSASLPQLAYVHATPGFHSGFHLVLKMEDLEGLHYLFAHAIFNNHPKEVFRLILPFWVLKRSTPNPESQWSFSTPIRYESIWKIC